MPRWLPPVFFASGFAALLYQVAWQRALFTLFGINVESVTMVVTAFMLGLGVGSFAGGVLSRNPELPALRYFAAAEAGIGVFGFASMRLFEAVGGAMAGGSAVAAGTVIFALVLVPTTLMGGTLPLLIAHSVRVSGNVGGSVGTLYCANTVGSAIASLAAVLVLQPVLGLQGCVSLAAVVNVLVAGTVIACGRSR